MSALFKKPMISIAIPVFLGGGAWELNSNNGQQLKEHHNTTPPHHNITSHLVLMRMLCHWNST